MPLLWVQALMPAHRFYTLCTSSHDTRAKRLSETYPISSSALKILYKEVEESFMIVVLGE
jgi:hypothetical protein